MDSLPALIQAVRDASRNRSVGILAGGPILLERPEIAATLGADATAIDGREAILWVESVCRT